MLHILQKYKQYFILFSFIVISRSPGFFNISTESDFATYILVANSYVSGLGLYNNIIEIKPFLNSVSWSGHYIFHLLHINNNL
jgi:hypothetical protein